MSEESSVSMYLFHFLGADIFGCEYVRLVFGKIVKKVFTDMEDIVISLA
jgi:hypothetical protein